jgi:hypothetical protein
MDGVNMICVAQDNVKSRDVVNTIMEHFFFFLILTWVISLKAEELLDSLEEIFYLELV